MVEGAAGWMQLSKVLIILLIYLVITDGSGPKDWGHTTQAVVETTTPQPNVSFSSSNSLTPSAFLKKLVQLHSYYCDSNRVCEHYSASECYRCAPCQCDASCHDYEDCCPDVPEKKALKHIPSHLFAGMHNAELDCVSVDVPISNLVSYAASTIGHERNGGRKTLFELKDLKALDTLPSSFERYFMISRCPSDFQGDRYLCEETNGQPPVTSQNNDSFVYKNRHCAFCHGEGSGVEEWPLRVSCDASKNFTSFHSSRNVGYAALVKSDCTISYSPASPKYERRCYSQPNMISKCNETGQIHSVDPFLQKACDFYLTPKTVDGKVYKNVFCYLCNLDNTPFTPGPGQCDSHPMNGKKSFEATLDKQDMSQEWISQSLFYDAGYDVCGDTGLYDYEEQMCRPVFCTFGQRMRPAACSCNPAFQTVKGLTYEIYFKLQPEVPIELSGEHDLLHRLPDEMEIHLGKMLQRIQVKIEDFAMAFNTTDIRGHCNQATKDLALYARVKCHAMIDQRKLQKHLMNFRKGKFHIVTRNWNVSLQSIPCEKPWHLMHPSRRHAPHFLSPCVTIVANDHFERRKGQAGTKRVGTTTPSPEVVYARMTSPPDIRISSLLTCAQVQLLPKEYILGSIGDSLLFQWNGDAKIIPEDRYLVDLDGNVTICLSDFLSKLTNKHGKRRTNIETMCALILLPISMLCLLACLFIFTIFPVLRSLSGKNNIILVACLFLSQLTIFVGYTVDDTSIVCTIMGVFCHYFSLSLFLTLAICSYHVYTIFNVMHLSVDITKETRAFLLYCCCILITPLLLIVIIMIAFNQSTTTPSAVGYGGGPLCFLSSSTAMWLTLFVPLMITAVIAFILFAMTFCTLRNNADVETNATDERHVHFYFRATILTTITWIVGAAALHVATSNVRIVFIFCQFFLGIFVMIGLVCTRRIVGLLSTFCCCTTSRAKHLNIIKMDSVKSSGTTTSHPSVIVTGFRQKDSPRIYTNNEKPFFRGSNGYSTDESQA